MSGPVGRQMTSVQRTLLKRRPIICFRGLYSYYSLMSLYLILIVPVAFWWLSLHETAIDWESFLDRTELNLWTAMDNKRCKRKAVNADSWWPSSVTKTVLEKLSGPIVSNANGWTQCFCNSKYFLNCNFYFISFVNLVILILF